MQTFRSILAIAIVALLLAACGGSAATQQPAGGGGGGGGGGTATEVPAATEAGGGGGGGGGGGSGQDVEAVGNQLVPPNSTEVSKTTAEDTWFVIYESTDSVDSLKSFYENAVPKTGLRIISTTTIQGGVSYVIATDDSGAFGGAINIYPSGDGKTAVQVTVGKS
jgi:hypothetical protein